MAFDGRYCIVGAGPCGLLAARAFTLAGIPYDQFERHRDVGGIWDIDNPGTSMYQSAHFISSKFTSNFFGAPMPDHYPDYPDHRQILDYIRDFARRFGLRDKVTFGVEVLRATPIGADAAGGWRVELSSGESRVYKGLVVANGVTWTPSLPALSGPGGVRGRGATCGDLPRSPAEFAGRRVLMVGGGNSGVDIACDAARAADAAFISLRRGYHFVPKHIFGVPTDVFLSRPGASAQGRGGSRRSRQDAGGPRRRPDPLRPARARPQGSAIASDHEQPDPALSGARRCDRQGRRRALHRDRRGVRGRV